MDGKKPYLVVLLVNSIYAGMHMISKVAFDKGMSTFVFILYRQAIASIFLAPIAIIIERKKAPRLHFVLFIKILLLSLFGVTTSLNLYGVALNYTSATVAAATTNSVPVITFFMALVLGMEKLKMRSLSGITKLLGVTLCLSGVITIAFFKGPQLKLDHLRLFHHHTSSPEVHGVRSEGSWIKGTFLMITANSAWSLWIVLQGRVLMEYPSKLLFTAIQCVFSTIQSFFLTLAFERDFSRWKLSLDVGLLAVVYSGVVVTGISFYLQAWCIEKKGPVFLTMSTPLGFVITLVFSSLLLGEMTCVGSVLGGLLMVGGLYSVLWGKSKEGSNDVKLPVVVDGKNGREEDIGAAASPSSSLSSNDKQLVVDYST